MHAWVYFIQTDYHLQWLQKRQEQVQEDVDKILELLQNYSSNTNILPDTSAIHDKHIINGCNVMTMSTRDEYSFGLALMDRFLTLEELCGSLVYTSPKSKRKGLDRVRVSCI